MLQLMTQGGYAVRPNYSSESDHGGCQTHPRIPTGVLPGARRHRGIGGGRAPAADPRTVSSSTRHTARRPALAACESGLSAATAAVLEQRRSRPPVPFPGEPGTHPSRWAHRGERESVAGDQRGRSRGTCPYQPAQRFGRCTDDGARQGRKCTEENLQTAGGWW